MKIVDERKTQEKEKTEKQTKAQNSKGDQKL